MNRIIHIFLSLSIGHIGLEVIVDQWICNYCHQQYKYQSTCRRHENSCPLAPSNKKTQFKCVFCDYCSGRKDALQRHMRSLHPLNIKDKHLQIVLQ